MRAQLVLDTRTQLCEHILGNVLGSLRDEEDADTLRPDEPHRLRHGLKEGLRSTGEEQMSFVEEEHE